MIGSSVLVVILLFASYVFLGLKSADMREQSSELEDRRAVSTQQRQQLETLNRQKSDLTQQLSLLASLRSGAPAQSVFVAIDRALADAEVWFVNWQFRRAGVIVPEEQATGVQTGYFIVVPEGSAEQRDGNWLVETHMTIKGQARDHAALSQFVNGLYSQPAIVDVSVQRTALRKIADYEVVDFDLAVVLNSETRG